MKKYKVPVVAYAKTVMHYIECDSFDEYEKMLNEKIKVIRTIWYDLEIEVLRITDFEEFRNEATNEKT